LAAAVLAVLTVPVPGEAAQRISLAIRGDANAALRKQLGAVLCKEYVCVPISRIRTGGKLDFAKVEAQRVAIIVAGTVARSRKGGGGLEVALLTRSLGPVWERSYPLGKGGTLSRDSTMDLADDLRRRLGGGPQPSPRAGAPGTAPAPSPLVAAPPPIATAPPPAAALPPVPLPPPPSIAPPTTRSEPPAAAPPRAVAEQAAKAPATAPASSSGGGARPGARLLAAVEAGAYLAQRTLSYQGVPAGNALLGYEANLVGPGLHLELYPASLLTENAFAGIGLFADYSFSVGLKTTDPVSGAEHPTSFTRLGAGVCWRLHPVPSSRFALVPALSYQQLKFTIEPLAGVSIQGLPDANLSGVKAGVAAEIPLSDAVSILLGVGYVKWTTAGDLVGDGFFPSGSAHALEAEAGLSVAFSGLLSLRVVGDYSGTQYSLQPDPSGTYQASSAADQYLGGRIMLRAQF
jgi:hypothetical protein